MKIENRYGWSERLLHKLAFGSGGIQVALADIEDQLYRKQLQDVVLDRPVFVTALPRAGTTMVLNLLAETGEFATHTYRDMPFVLCPMIWQNLAKGFQSKEEASERAHGDGLMISADSPEAFEEIIWKQFWKQQYQETHIELWQSCDDPEFVEFFLGHMKKIAMLRGGAGQSTLRYVSKNNLNISRLACLPKLLPEAKFIVPFRDPVQHAASLLKQHRSFLAAHEEDEFTSRYMESIGHYDFGKNLRPVNFDGWLASDRRREAVDLGFWLEYWIAAYRHILAKSSEAVRLLSYRNLTENPEPTLSRMAAFLGLKDQSRLVAQSASLRPPRQHDVDLSKLSPETVDEARALYADLERCSES